ncbi:MAG: hypothetical protein ABH842_02025 [Candidatus Micrarchaeota archaeon]
MLVDFMYYCQKCKKEIIQYSISMGAESSIESMQAWAKKNNKIIIFNPSPFEKLKCPICFSELSDDLQK